MFEYPKEKIDLVDIFHSIGQRSRDDVVANAVWKSYLNIQSSCKSEEAKLHLLKYVIDMLFEQNREMRESINRLIRINGVVDIFNGQN